MQLTVAQLEIFDNKVVKDTKESVRPHTVITSSSGHHDNTRVINARQSTDLSVPALTSFTGHPELESTRLSSHSYFKQHLTSRFPVTRTGL